MWWASKSPRDITPSVSWQSSTKSQYGMVRLSFKQRIDKIMAAESKNKSVTNGQPSKNRQESKLWSLICMAKEVGDTADGVQNYAAFIEEKEKLQSDLNAKMEENTRLRLDHDKVTQAMNEREKSFEEEKSILTTTFGQKYAMFDHKEKAFEGLRSQVDGIRDECKKAKEDARCAQGQLAHRESALKNEKAAQEEHKAAKKKLERECTTLRTELTATVAKRDELASNLEEAEADLGHASFHDFGNPEKTMLYANMTQAPSFGSGLQILRKRELASLFEESRNLTIEFLSDTDVAKVTCYSPESNLVINMSIGRWCDHTEVEVSTSTTAAFHGSVQGSHLDASCSWTGCDMRSSNRARLPPVLSTRRRCETSGVYAEFVSGG